MYQQGIYIMINLYRYDKCGTGLSSIQAPITILFVFLVNYLSAKQHGVENLEDYP